MDSLKNLNPKQKEAVLHTDGPTLILAGAGSGKTRVLTHRIAYLLKEKNILPQKILAVTFTNKASQEMKERLEKLIGAIAHGLWLGTFHSTGLRILRQDGHSIGFDKDFIVYDDDDQLSLVKLSLAELGYSEKAMAPRAVLSHINQAKNEILSPQEYALGANDFFRTRVSAVYNLYQEKLRSNRALDFGDLILEPIRLFKQAPDVLKKYQNRFSYILIDEYQDTNRAQYILINLLAEAHKNLCVVGDEDQSIYGWRGADISNILNFEKDYPDVKIIRLEQNYRSTKNILAAANSVVEKNVNRIGKTLWTENRDGSVPLFQMARDERHEAAIAASKIEKLKQHNGYDYKHFAIFYRTNAQSRIFEEHFIRSGMPYTIVGGLRFYDRKEIKDSLAYLRVLANPSDSLSLMRIINTPARGIGKTTLDKVAGLAAEKGVSIFECLTTLDNSADNMHAIKPNTFQKLKGFSALVQKFQGLVGKEPDLSPAPLQQVEREKGAKPPLHETAKGFLEQSGYIKMWEEEKTEEADTRVENIHELISAIKDFEMYKSPATHPSPSPASGEGITSKSSDMLSDFLDHVALISDIDSFEDKHNRVTMMTIHSAKGLEFPVVFMVGMEEGLFPHSRSLDEGSADELEEERRLCYVGMTRAMEKLFMTAARERTIYGDCRFQRQSRFIDEIDERFIEIAETEAKQKGQEDRVKGQGAWVMGQEAMNEDARYRTQETRYTSLESQIETGGIDFADDGLRVGMKVRHPNFGIGIIKATEGIGENTKVTVNFQNVGQKKLVLRVAGLIPMQ
ncbi:MAG: UvrD-helicase domain-containing protein [Deltaproteobacteria bacterium]|nr:UvrD-helicase domain-containing protein [Deltaproteobacteria bacterium]